MSDCVLLGRALRRSSLDQPVYLVASGDSYRVKAGPVTRSIPLDVVDDPARFTDLVAFLDETGALVRRAEVLAMVKASKLKKRLLRATGEESVRLAVEDMLTDPGWYRVLREML